MAEIEHLYALYRFNILYVHDEVFAVQASMAREFTEQLIALKQRLGIEFDWGCYLRVNAVDLDLLMLMKQSSCCFIGFGM
ncbi:MAG: hypothetical protein J0653_04680, partial [Deltaproteobacteria bacterium]|nr:hypothetical protein [Deltaproteobacteria bacterium]